MAQHEEFNKLGERLEKLLILRYAPIAVKLIKTEADIPEGAIRPKRDLGEHLAALSGVCNGAPATKKPCPAR